MKEMKAQSILAALLLMVASLQTLWAKGFRVYRNDGTMTQFSLRTDSIVFSDGIGEDVDFGPFTAVNQLITGTWYKSETESVTFNEDGTTDYVEGATYRFLPYQGNVIVSNADGAIVNILRVYDMVDGHMVMGKLGDGGQYTVYSREQPVPSINGHEYVEIAGLKWATMNVGATTIAGEYATCCGDYFAWGETEPRYATLTRRAINSTSFTWKDGYSSGYSSDNFPTYTGTTLDAAHDAATVNWGGSWRTPTNAEYKALAKACSGRDIDDQLPVNLISKVTKGGIYWLTATQTIEPAYMGVAGILFVSASDVSKRVFFPASGFLRDATLHYCSKDGDYWSSSLYTSNAEYAHGLDFDSENVDPGFRYLLYLGYAVRPVSD